MVTPPQFAPPHILETLIGVAFLTDRVFKAGTFFHDENDSAAAYFEK